MECALCKISSVQNVCWEHGAYTDSNVSIVEHLPSTWFGSQRSFNFGGTNLKEHVVRYFQAERLSATGGGVQVIAEDLGFSLGFRRVGFRSAPQRKAVLHSRQRT